MNITRSAPATIPALLALTLFVTPAAHAAPGGKTVFDVADSSWILTDATATLKGKAAGLGKTKGKSPATLEVDFAGDSTWTGLLNGTLMLSGTWETTSANGRKLELQFDDATRILVEDTQAELIEAAMLAEGLLADVQLDLADARIKLRLKPQAKKNLATLRLDARLVFEGTVTTLSGTKVDPLGGTIRMKGKSLSHLLEPLLADA